MKIPDFTASGDLPSAGAIPRDTTSAGQEFAGLAQLGQGAASIGDAARRIQQEWDGVEVLKKSNEYEAALRGMKASVAAAEGEAAQGLTPKIEEELTKLRADHLGSLKNANQRMLFEKWADQKNNTFLSHVVDHEMTQRKVALKNQVEGRLSQSLASVMDPTTGAADVEQSVADMRAAIRFQYPGQDTTAREMAAESGLLSAFVGKIMVNDPDAADAFLQKNRARLGDHANALDARLKVVREEKRVEDLYQSLKDVPLPAALDALEKDQGLKPHLRSKVVSALRTEDAIRKSAEHEAQKKRDDDGLKLALDRWSSGTPLTLPEMQKAGFSGTMQEHILKLNASWATKESKESDGAALYALTDRVRQGDIADSASLLQAVADSGRYISQKDLMHLQGQMFTAQKEGTAADARKAKLAASISKESEQVFGQYFKGGIKKHEDEWVQFRSRLDQEIEAQDIQSPKQASDLMHDLMKKTGRQSGWFWDSKVREFQGDKPSPGFRPDPLKPLIEKQARALNYPQELLAVLPAMIQQESGGSSAATSRKGAKGVMQLMPDAWAEMGGGDIRDPETNIKNGMGYLKKMYDRFGSVELALAAYNAGPGAVEKHGGVPPFKETQEYVKRITGKAPSSPAQQVAAFFEGQRIRSRTDGRIYVVRNGVPVPE